MKPLVIDARGQIILNCLRTGEISIQIAGPGGTVGAILTPVQAVELSCGLVSAIREAKRG